MPKEEQRKEVGKMEAPEIEIIKFISNDVIATSGGPDEELWTENYY